MQYLFHSFKVLYKGAVVIYFVFDKVGNDQHNRDPESLKLNLQAALCLVYPASVCSCI